MIRILLLCLLALPLSAQVGVWEGSTVRTIAGTTVEDGGRIVFRPDHTYASARRWSWVEDGEPHADYSYAEGTWSVRADSLCVQRDDRQEPLCLPFTLTPHSLRWGPFEFTAAGELAEGSP
ncbi:MAG: hypothetical protein IPK12_23415 [Gemmatimonadetes bacterium]|nr:hypothetical protein [Gemmatimonadota bacterium]